MRSTTTCSVFFRRYYSEGDFLAKRVYKPGVYAIPYEGEEVTLHWANKDQYYVKTSEYLRDYVFHLRSDGEKNPMRVHFLLTDAAEGEHGNVKPAEGKGHVFILTAPGESGCDFIAEDDGGQGKELVIRFEYRAAALTDWPDDERGYKKKPPVQKDLIRLAANRILAVADAALAPWNVELSKQHVMASGERADYSRLEAHLRRYTARNSYDYFIHKGLGAFLRRELDFYIMNEVMHLDNVENESAPRVEEYLSKIKVIRKIAGKIIDFLAQLEDFQKKLWLKKKFVVETHYCIAVGIIPEAFYPEIAANAAQSAEWVKLLAIDEIKGDLTTPSFSKKLKPEFLKAHPTLVVDTQHFGAGFTERLLEAIGDVDEQTDGVLFHSENFQSLSLMQMRYREKVKCVYIDPPYNTSENTFVYKNMYKHSSWLTMIQNRVQASRALLDTAGVLQCAIDDTETSSLRGVLDSVFGTTNRAATIAIEVNPAGQNLRPNTPALSHDYCHIYACTINQMEMFTRALTEEEQALYKGKDSKGTFLWDNLRRRGGNSRPSDRPGQWFPLYVNRATKQVSVDKISGFEEIWPIDPQGERRIWRVNPTGARREIAAGEVSVIEKAERLEIVKKTRMPEGKKPKTLWSSSKYSTTTYGTKLLIDIMGEQQFSYPKSLHLVIDCLRFWCDEEGQVLDYFGGSGTTGHAVINLNREDSGQRKFILVEMGDYFDTVLVPRIKKVTFTPEWKNGKPKRIATPEEAERSPRIVKVVRLESYEDALNNLEPRRTDRQKELLDSAEAQGADGLREQYILHYMLDVETRGSQSLLNVRAFTDPTAYRLKVKRPGSDENREANVDLLETFNWLIGLTVRHISAPQAFNAAFKRDSERRLRLKSRLKQEECDPYWFRAVTGATPNGRRTLVIWRKLTGKPERDNLVLDEWFTRQGYSAKESEFDLIYVNGGNNLENLKAPDDLWKIRLIEEDFHRLMFEMEIA